MSPGEGRCAVPLFWAALRGHGQGFASPRVLPLKLRQRFLLPIPFLALPLGPSTLLGAMLCSPLNSAPQAKPLPGLFLIPREVVFCPLLIIPLRRLAEPCDDLGKLSLLLVSQKVLPRRDLETDVGHSSAGDRTSPGFVPRHSSLSSPSPWMASKERCFLLPQQTGELLLLLRPPPEPMVNAMGPSQTSVLGTGVKLHICKQRQAVLPLFDARQERAGTR